jgi:hypothetical protein
MRISGAAHCWSRVPRPPGAATEVFIECALVPAKKDSLLLYFWCGGLVRWETLLFASWPGVANIRSAYCCMSPKQPGLMFHPLPTADDDDAERAKSH